MNQRQITTLILVALACLLPGRVQAQDTDSPENALLGTWLEVDADIPRIPKLLIAKNASDQLTIQFWTANSKEDDEPSTDEQELVLLSRYDESTLKGREAAVAYTYLESKESISQFTLKVISPRSQKNAVLKLEGIKLLSKEGEVGRIVNAVYTHEGKKPSEDSKNGDETKPSDNDEEESEQAADNKSEGGDSKSMNDATATKKKAKRVVFSGRIESGSTLRGRLMLTPTKAEDADAGSDDDTATDSKILPAGGVMVASASPTFRFTNVPEGNYTVKFQGTVSGSTRTLLWEDIEVKGDGSAPQSLRINEATSP